MSRSELPSIEMSEMKSLADRLTELINNHPDTRLIFVEAIIAALQKGDLSQARWFAFESGDKWSSGYEDIQEFIVHELFFDTVDSRMNPLDDDW